MMDAIGLSAGTARPRRLVAWSVAALLASTAAGPASAQTATWPGEYPAEQYLDDWFVRSDAAKASQPHWMTPVATVTPRLEQEFRFDTLWQHQGNGASLVNIDGGKGLELIPTGTNEILLNLPPAEQRTVKKPAVGQGDWPFLTVKQRLLSANEENGDYILTAFLGFTAPTGSDVFGNKAWQIAPTLAGGVGWGDFDVQATVGAALPMSHVGTIGDSIVTNVAFQYHVDHYFWPEVEFNDTYWSGGLRDGKNQLFLTPGVVLGRFPVGGRFNGSIGGGYQLALSPDLTTKPVQTPTFEHGWILTARLAF